MNRIILLPIGILIAAQGSLMCIPALLDALNASADWKAFTVSSAFSIAIGVLLALSGRGHPVHLSRRDGYLLTVGIWLSLSAVSALPFWLSEFGISFTDATFEAISGLTTTGSTVLSHLDDMPKGLLLWRAILQWIGGIGIVVMAVTLLPFLRIGGMQLYRMETSDQSEKISPRIADICIRIALVYVLLTLVCGLLYGLEGMNAFEAAVHAMTTVSTGGFSTSDQSIGHFASPSIEWTATSFMLLGSLPFSVYILYFRRFNWTVFRDDSQTVAFLGYTAVLIVIVASYLWVSAEGTSYGDDLRLAAFNVVSVISTTGYASTDYLSWGAGFASVFFFLSLLGGCAGSTAGGLKAFRLIAMWKNVTQLSKTLIHPHAVQSLYLGERRIEWRDLSEIYLFFFIMMAVLACLSLALGLTGLDFTTSISAATTAITNVGPGLGDVIGPSGTFQSLNSGAKWLLDFGMLAGRLEYLTVLVLLLPEFWTDR